MDITNTEGEDTVFSKIVMGADETARLMAPHVTGLTEIEKARLLEHVTGVGLALGMAGAPFTDAVFAKALRLLADTLDVARPQLQQAREMARLTQQLQAGTAVTH